MKKLYIAAVATIAALFAAGLAACTEPNTAKEYYLSTGTIYSTAEEVPADALFEADGATYTLTASLDAGTEFTVNEVGGAAIGWSAVLSARTELTEGANGAIHVGETGSYALKLDVAQMPTITYTFTPAQTPSNDVTSVRFTRLRAKMQTGAVEQFTAVAVRKDGTEESDVTWSSSNEAVATVSPDGYVSALSAGTVNIIAEKEGKTATASVTVEGDPYIAATGITVSPKTVTLELGGTQQLTYTLEPANASATGLLWTSANEEIVTVENGLVKAVAYGEAKITATTRSGYTATCTVTVRRPVLSVFLEESVTLVAGGEAKTVVARINPANATDLSYTAEVTEGEGHIELTDLGEGQLLLSGLSAGTAEITVTSNDNPEAKATCAVNVLAAGTKQADLSAREIVVTKGGAAEVTALFDGGEITSVEWEFVSIDYDTAQDNPERIAAWADIKPSEDNKSCTVTGVEFGTGILEATINGQTVTCKVLVTSDYFYLTGSGELADTATGWDLVGSLDEADRKGRLLTETERGVYTVTRRFENEDAFMIVFPELDSEWETAIMYSNYYVADSSASSLSLSHTTDWKNVVIFYPGEYTIKLDLSTDLPYFSVIPSKIDVDDISLSGKPTYLEKGQTESGTITASVLPTAAATGADIEWWVDQLYRDWVTLTPDGLTCTVTLTDAVEGALAVSVRIYCSVSGHESYYALSVVPAGATKVPVTQVRFLYDSYKINLSDRVHTLEVRAITNSDATNTMVTYSLVNSAGTAINSNSFSISASGLLTASSPRILYVKATSVDNPKISAMARVIVYSDQFYLAGILEGVDKWNTDNSANYGFTQVNDTEFKLSNVWLNCLDRFKIPFIGINSNWTGATTSVSFDKTRSTKKWVDNDGAVMVLEAAYYDITLKLSDSNSIIVEKVADGTPEQQNQQFSVTVMIHHKIRGWPILGTSTITFDGSAQTNTVTVRIPKDIKIDQGSIEYVIQIEGVSQTAAEAHPVKWVASPTGTGVTTEQKATDKWITLNNGQYLWYGGTVTAKATDFILTFGEDPTTPISLVINEVDG